MNIGLRKVLQLLVGVCWIVLFALGGLGPQLHAETLLSPIGWGVSARCMYEAVNQADDVETVKCTEFAGKKDKVEVVREQEGTLLAEPIYRFSFDDRGSADDPLLVIVDVRSFQKLREDEYFAPMEISFNTGGSGWFSLLGFGLVHPSTKTIGPTFGIRAGDRCNDGFAEFTGIERGSDGGVRSFKYRTALTPFRLLNPTDATNWRMLRVARSMVGDQRDEKFPMPRSLNDWLPYDDIANAAMLCVGWLDKEFDFNTLQTRVLGVTVDVPGVRAFDAQTPAERCAFNVVAKSLKQDSDTQGLQGFALREWESVLKQVSSSCDARQ